MAQAEIRRYITDAAFRNKMNGISDLFLKTNMLSIETKNSMSAADWLQALQSADACIPQPLTKLFRTADFAVTCKSIAAAPGGHTQYVHKDILGNMLCKHPADVMSIARKARFPASWLRLLYIQGILSLNIIVRLPNASRSRQRTGTSCYVNVYNNDEVYDIFNKINKKPEPEPEPEPEPDNTYPMLDLISSEDINKDPELLKDEKKLTVFAVVPDSTNIIYSLHMSPITAYKSAEKHLEVSTYCIIPMAINFGSDLLV